MEQESAFNPTEAQKMPWVGQHKLILSAGETATNRDPPDRATGLCKSFKHLHPTAHVGNDPQAGDHSVVSACYSPSSLF